MISVKLCVVFLQYTVIRYLIPSQEYAKLIIDFYSSRFIVIIFHTLNSINKRV